jgi:hypothetical protein
MLNGIVMSKYFGAERFRLRIVVIRKSSSFSFLTEEPGTPKIFAIVVIDKCIAGSDNRNNCTHGINISCN